MTLPLFSGNNLAIVNHTLCSGTGWPWLYAVPIRSVALASVGINHACGSVFGTKFSSAASFHAE